MNRTPDDPTRLMNLLVAICGDQINSYRSKIEALLAHPQHERQVCEDPARRRTEGTTHEQVVPLLCWEVGEALAPVGRKRNRQRLTAHARRLRRQAKETAQ